MMVQNEFASYIINSNSSDGCCICFTTREYMAGENGQCWMVPLSRSLRSSCLTMRTHPCGASTTTTVLMHMPSLQFLNDVFNCHFYENANAGTNKKLINIIVFCSAFFFFSTNKQ
jgi:hypothetical protein